MEKGTKRIKKLTYALFIGLALLLTVFHTTNVFAAAVEASHKEVNELTAEESAKLQKGLPTDLKDGDRVIYVYQATGSCDLAPTPVANTLPNTGMNTDTVATMSLAIVAIGLAGYFIYKNKKSREFLLVVLAVGTGVFVAHNVSAATKTNLHEQIQARVRHAEYDLLQPQQDLECFEYIGYVKLQAPVEQPTTVETTTQSTTATVTVPEETTQSTTVPVTVPEEPTQTTTTTEEVKKGTYRRTLEITLNDFIITGDYDTYVSQEKEALSRYKYYSISPYKFDHQGLKVLANGKEVVPTKVSENSYGRAKYQYVIDKLEGKVGDSIDKATITFAIGDREYASLEDLNQDFDNSYSFETSNSIDKNGKMIGGNRFWTEGFSERDSNVFHRSFIEGHIEEYIVIEENLLGVTSQ